MSTIEHALVKKAHLPTLYTTQQLEEFAQCANPVTGPEYFINNFFYIQHPAQGKVPLKMYDYQKRLTHTYHNYRFSISMLPRQMGKSTVAAGYLLWYAMFVPDSTILVAAHKYLGAQEIMQRVRYGYESCPDHIRAGMVSYNKGSLEFDNGSRIVSQTTTENTGRGMSISLLYCLDGDTSRVQIRNKQTLVQEEITLRQLHGRSSMQDQYYVQNHDYDILTPSGWKNFQGITQTPNKVTHRVQLATGEYVDATAGHYFFVHGQKVQLRELSVGQHIDTLHGPTAITAIDELQVTNVYDIIEVDHPEHQFIVNDNFITKNCDELAHVRPTIANEFWTAISPTLATGGKCIITSTPNSDEDQFAHLWKGANKCEDAYGNATDLGANGFKAFRAYWQEHPARDQAWSDQMRSQLGSEKYAREIDCEFIINEETLISPFKLLALTSQEPLYKTGQVRWYARPEPDKIYVVGLDPSLGTGGDPAAIQVFEANTTRQIAEWRHNQSDIPTQIRTLNDIVQHIFEHTNDAQNIYYSVENNTLGEAALISIAEWGEENIRGYFLSDPQITGQRRYRKGFNTNTKSKIAACAKLKNLIESGRMHIHSASLVSELKNFVAKGVAYAAKPGETDDLVMATLLITRMLQVLKSYHSELDHQIRDHGDTMIEPMPFISMFH